MLAGPRGVDPVPNRKCAGNQAQGDEDHHGPDKCRRLGDAQDGSAKLDRQQAEHGKPDGAGNEVDRGHAPQGVAERAGGGNDHGEGEGRRRETADGNGNSGAITNSFLQLVELFLPGDFSNAFLAEFAGDPGKQNNSDGRAAGGGEDVDDKSGMVARDEANHKQVISERKHEERGVENAEDKRAKITKVKQ